MMEYLSTFGYILLWVLVLFNLLLTFALARRLNMGNMKTEGLKVGQKAPDFKATTLDGSQVVLNDFLGHPFVLLFISPTCGPCREALPQYLQLSTSAEQIGVRFLLVSIGAVEPTRNLLAEYGSDFQVLVAPMESNAMMDNYKITSTPSYCTVDAVGKVHSTGYPGTSWNDWKLPVSASQHSIIKPLDVSLSGGR